MRHRFVLACSFNIDVNKVIKVQKYSNENRRRLPYA